jgi:asparagine synthase (glutamine-hydrolysing)
LGIVGDYSFNNVQKVSYLYLKAYLHTLLIQEDKISMAHSVEARTPLLDRRVIDLSLSIPMRVKVHNGNLKAIPKAAMRGYLPSILYRQSKRGFPTPIVEWYRKELFKPTLELLLDGTPPALKGVFNRHYIEQDFNRFKEWKGLLPSYAYAIAHRFYSLSALYVSIDQMFSIKPYMASDKQSRAYENRKIRGH